MVFDRLVAERRKTERRGQREIQKQIRARGYAVVGIPAFERPPAAAPLPPERKAR